MTSQQLIDKYLEFFKSKGHQIIPGASLIPEHDPSVLFTTAGMHPLVPFLLGEKHPQGKRLTDLQRCIRTVDIDNVGDNWHSTFFEMLGNWSLGDYFKEDAIKLAYEFLTNKEYLNIYPGKLSVTVFAGDDTAPKDDEAIRTWLSLGIPEERIYALPKEDNWWGPAGETGPCGPDTEIFYDTDKEKCSDKCQPGCGCGKYVEIWNLVFMCYNKTKEGRFLPLAQKNIDTGMGVERTLAILHTFDNSYETELFKPVMDLLEDKLSGHSQDFNDVSKDPIKSKRIIADHIRASVFLLMDGVTPSNLDQGYILRRLIRRAVRHAKLLEIKKEEKVNQQIAKLYINIYKERYPKLLEQQDIIINELQKEEDKFEISLNNGLKVFAKITTNLKDNKITGLDAFHLYDTYGFPIEMTIELAKEKNLTVDEKEFNQEFIKHQELSRKGAEKKFKGGLADHSEMTTKLHTATHLLHQALRQVLGEQVQQKGSNINPERLRFDFNHGEKMTPEQLANVEKIVNDQIQKGLDIKMEEMSVDEAKKSGAIGLFAEKYGDKVKVYSIGDFSKEICGGPHAKNTKELHHFKIKKEESSSAGVRRIKAILQ
ncbi:MAG: alanine--tRNA ligase [Patescibacteria group bacterium]|nr:alanine--tRNA ligase [Patescibacteria group bacterium]